MLLSSSQRLSQIRYLLIVIEDDMGIKPKTNSKTFSQDILNGKGEVYLMPRSGGVYQFRMWIPDEKKYLRRSLKTTDKETAINRAEKKVFEVHSDLATGRKLFGITLGELVDKYLEWRWTDVEINRITKERWGTIRSQTNALLRVKKSELCVAELDENSFYDWRQMRSIDNPTVSLVTVRNETATIKQMFEYAYREGLSHFPTLNFRPLTIKKDDIGRRGTFTVEEYDSLIGFMRQYVSKKHCPNPIEREQRLVIRDYILLLSNTCLRVGELRQMLWSDILGVEERTNEVGQLVSLVSLRVRAEISKVRTSRDIITRGGEYIKRLKKNSEFTEPHHYLFSNKDGKHQLGTRELYKHWYALMEGIGIDNHRERKLTYYSLRHFGITMRLRMGESIFTVANMSGTSVGHIESHYGHIDEQMKIDAALKHTKINRTGIGEISPI